MGWVVCGGVDTRGQDGWTQQSIGTEHWVGSVWWMGACGSRACMIAMFYSSNLMYVEGRWCVAADMVHTCVVDRCPRVSLG